MSSNIVTHPGIIREIRDHVIDVKIIVTSACVSCKLKGVCNPSDMDEKTVLINVDDPSQYKEGQKIIVEMKQSLGNWAVLLGYVFPFLILFLSLIVLTSFNIDEGLAGLISIGLLIPYYLVLYLTRNKMSKKFNYSIK